MHSLGTILRSLQCLVGSNGYGHFFLLNVLVYGIIMTSRLKYITEAK